MTGFRKISNGTLVSIALLTSSGCGVYTPLTRNPQRFNQFATGTERREVIKKVGQPYSTKLIEGNRTDEYIVYARSTAALDAILCPFTATLSCWIPAPGWAEQMWVRYQDDKIVALGRPKDLGATDYDMRIRTKTE